MIVRRSATAQASAAREGDAEMRVCAVVIAHSACMSMLYLSSIGADWAKNGARPLMRFPEPEPEPSTFRGEDARTAENLDSQPVIEAQSLGGVSCRQ